VGERANTHGRHVLGAPTSSGNCEAKSYSDVLAEALSGTMAGGTQNSSKCDVGACEGTDVDGDCVGCDVGKADVGRCDGPRDVGKRVGLEVGRSLSCWIETGGAGAREGECDGASVVGADVMRRRENTATSTADLVVATRSTTSSSISERVAFHASSGMAMPLTNSEPPLATTVIL